MNWKPPCRHVQGDFYSEIPQSSIKPMPALTERMLSRGAFAKKTLGHGNETRMT